MSAPQNTIALIFDFDDTLTDDSTTSLLSRHGVDVDEFWKKRMPSLVLAGWDPTLAYLNMILDLVGDGCPLGKLSNAKLREFGGQLQFYEGLPEIFADLDGLVKEHRISHPSIEYYIISGGLEEIIRGSSIAGYFHGIWGCRFSENSEGIISRVMNCISFTEKTKYIFHINKGLDASARERPYDVNRATPLDQRRIPLSNMIYVGDGLTDVPCFSLLEKSGGRGFGVFDPTKEGSPKKAWESLAAPHRVVSLNSPKYGETEDLGALLRVAVNQICVNLDLRSQMAV